MIEIRPLTHFNPDDLTRLMTGYISGMRYQVTQVETNTRFVLTLEIVPLAEPYCKTFEPTDDETLALYATLPALGLSFGAFEGETCVGLGLAEPRPWNRSVMVWELHVAETHRGKGLGRGLLAAVGEAAQKAGFRIIVCETQNTNVPAIGFYQRAGFHIESVDLSLYSNEDYPDGEIAVFMKKRL